jgi:signal transduction histidine kinase
MPSGGLLSLWTDITELKKANQALWAARLAAEEASRAKSTFLAHMSHEFRTPLNAIIGFSELITMQLYGPVENERYLEYLNNIASSAQHLHELVSAVLDISRLEAGKLSLRPQAISTWDISHDVLSLLPTNRAHWPRINVRGAAPDILVQIDRVSIRQALLNLLTNAIKASKATDEVWMEFRVTDRLIEFEVGDTGCGLSEQEVAAILQPFGQVHNRPEVARAERGIGLGVPITNGIAEAHGGALRYVTAPGKGTRAIISIPVQAAAA